MREFLLIGNPNVGKSTLFNSLTKSSEHTGNFHGVTMEEKSKIVKYENEEIKFVDLPGIYSLNTFSFEEEVSKNIILKPDVNRLVIVDANSLNRNLYLCLQLKELGYNFKILLNNYNSFLKRGNKLNVDLLSEKLGLEIEIINAKTQKISKKILKISKKLEKNEKNNKISQINDIFLENFSNNYKYLEKIVAKIKNKLNLSEKTIIFALNGIFFDMNDDEIKFISNFNEDAIEQRYNYINQILDECLVVNNKYAYGENKLDKFLLNPVFITTAFLLYFFASIYLIFFQLGPVLSNGLIWIFETLIFDPILNFLYMTTDNIWLLEFFSGGVIGSVKIILTFLPQVCLLFVFLTVLEDSGIISRMCYVFDDFLKPFGLNGKAVYILLMGLGCNTMSTLATRGMSNKSLKIKTAILNPYISCMARLPVFVLLSTVFFGKNAYYIIVGLYLLGLIIALILGAVLNKTILKNNQSELLLEFPPLRGLDFKHIFKVALVNALDFFKRVFGIILFVGVIMWVLTHTKFNLAYTSKITDSIVYTIANKISFIFAPIGLNSAGIVCALTVGIFAKELIASTFAICNNTTSSVELIESLSLVTSVVHFSLPSAVSFLIFSLLYAPCLSNLAVLKKETGWFYMWFCLISQFVIAYMLSFFAYQTLTKGIVFSVTSLIVIALIMIAVIFIVKQFSKKCNGKCVGCNCNKKS